MIHSQEMAVAIDGLSKRFGRRLALDHISLTVPRGISLALLGPNGAGKSTLVDILTTVTRPDSGQACVGGHDIRRDPRAVRAKIGVVFQRSTLDTRLSVRENLLFHAAVYQMTRASTRQRTAEMLDLAGLGEQQDALVSTLSGGMRRRLEIARALMHQPQILFLDEPSVGLDVESRQRLWGMIDTLRVERGVTLITSTHYIEEVESCDQVAILDAGQLLVSGTPNDLRAAHGHFLVRGKPVDAASVETLRDAYPTAGMVDGIFQLSLESQEQASEFIARLGAAFAEVTMARPSLESVFLKLTGRNLRTAAPARRGKGVDLG